MIQITTNAKDISNLLKNMKTNILKSQTALAQALGEDVKMNIGVRAPVWKGNLRGAVAMKIYPASHMVEVMMSTSEFNMIALENEYNISGERKISKLTDPKIAQWAADRGVFTDKDYVIVGREPTTHLGRQNKFFEPAFWDTNAKVPKIAEQIIGQAIMKTGW